MDTIVSPVMEFPEWPVVGNVLLPFGVRPVARITPGGYFVTGVPSTYAFELRKPPSSAALRVMWRPGDRVTSVRRNVAPVQVQAQERSDWIANVTGYARALNPAFSWTGPEISRTKPAYKDIQVGRDGRIWVQLHTAAVLDGSVQLENPPKSPFDAGRRWVEPVVYDVFEADGKYSGQVRFPNELTLPVMRGDLVWAVVRDSDDVQTIKRYRIR